MPVDYSAWSETPDSNATLDGFPVSNGNLQPANVDKGLRTLMAAIKSLSLSIPSAANFVAKAGAVFSGTQPTYLSEGAFLHHASSANTSGKVSFLVEGAADPVSPSNGDVVFFYQ